MVNIFNRLALLRSQGLRPIGTQVAIDTFCIIALCLIANRTPTRSDVAIVDWAVVLLLFIGAVRFWDRWPIAFPTMPFLFLQVIRTIIVKSGGSSGSNHQNQLFLLFLLRLGSNLLVATSVILCVLFPPLQLKPPTGLYPIGAIDVFLPRITSPKGGSSYAGNSDFVAARIFYPTTSSTKTLGNTPYFYHQSYRSNQFLHALAKSVLPASSPLLRCSWIFHTLKLIRIPASWQAPVMHPLETKIHHNNKHHLKLPSLWPVVIHSHGLFGSPHMYTHQALTLASNGTVVVMVHHQDGSSPMVFRRDGSALEYTNISNLVATKNDANASKEQKEQQYIALVRARRRQTHKRAVELISVFESLRLLHKNTDKENKITLPKDVCFQGKLDLSNVVFSGHSFGGAAALTAAAYRPDITLAVVAHEPATDWMPDFGRRALFMNEARRKGSNLPYSGGTGGFTTIAATSSNGSTHDITHHEEEFCYHSEQTITSISCSETNNNNSYNLHDNVHMFVLYSEEWAKLGWGGFPLLKCMHDREQFGPKNYPVSSSVEVIYQAKHMEFSDLSALTPLWLGRMMGSTGGRNPLETLDDIMHRTIDFLRRVRKL